MSIRLDRKKTAKALDLRPWEVHKYRGDQRRYGWNIGAFTKYAGNPILTLGGTGAFDSVHAGFGNCMRDEDGRFLLYYSGYNGTVWRCGLAYSTDGKTFTKFGEILAGVTVVVPTPFKFKGRYYFFYRDGALDIGLAYRTGDPMGAYTDLGKVLTKTMGTPEESGLDPFCVVLYANGLGILYYATVGSATYPQREIRLARFHLRDTGISITKYVNNPLSHLNQPTTDWGWCVSPPCVLKLGDFFVMMCHGYNQALTIAGLGMFYSHSPLFEDDTYGNFFIKDRVTPDPSIPLGGAGSWEETKAGCDPAGLIVDDELFLYYSGQDAGGTWRMGLAIAPIT